MTQAAQKRSRLKIRVAAEEDFPTIIRLVNSAFSVESFLEGTRTDEERMREMAKTGEFLVGEDEGGIVASMYCEVRGERAYLGMLAVDRSRQGTGLGRQMAEAAEDYFRQRSCRFLDITVLSLRSELLPLYRKLGFVENGTEEFVTPRLVKPGAKCHKIRMTKRL